MTDRNVHVMDVTEATFQNEVVERSKKTPVLVDFWAPWCGPCRTLSPILERVAADSDGAFILAKVNTDEAPNLAAQYNVRGIPAVKMFRGGRVVDEFVGVKPEREVRDFLKAFAPTQVDRWLMEAQSLVYGERWEEAAAAYRRILEAKPGYPPAALELGRMYLAAGRGAEAASALQEVPTSAAEYTRAETLLPLARLIAHAQIPNGMAEGLDALYRQAGQQVLERRIPEALDTLFDLLRKNRNYGEGEAKRAALALFEYLGSENPAVKEYRRQLASILF
ncbi:MAG TPA: thioredoxin [Anaerolineae bacterium]|nr:thioredoxin [Anaerolineae bacterium]